MILSLLAGLGIDFVKDLIEEKGDVLVTEGIKKVTGIDLTKKKELTTEEILAIKEAEAQIRNLDFEKLKLEFQNTDSARVMNSNIQTSANSSTLAKNAAYYIDFAIISATIFVGILLFAKSIPDANKELAYMMFGSLMTLSGTIINFHRGSTQGSRNKDDSISYLTKVKQ